MIGPEVGRFSGGLANRGDDICVDKVNRQWKYADVTGWKADPELTVTCNNNTIGKSYISIAIDPLGQPQSPAGSDHYLNTSCLCICLSIRPNFSK